MTRMMTMMMDHDEYDGDAVEDDGGDNDDDMMVMMV